MMPGKVASCESCAADVGRCTIRRRAPASIAYIAYRSERCLLDVSICAEALDTAVGMPSSAS